jgi:hypothetical protein
MSVSRPTHRPVRILALIVGAEVLLFAQSCTGKSTVGPGEDASADAASEDTPADGGVPSSDATPDISADAMSIQSTLVDDQSNLDGVIRLPNGGSWFSYGSTGGTVTPAPGGPFPFASVDAGSFSRAACVSGTGITGPFGGEGFRFQADADDGGIVPYDVSPYTGISFYVMSPDATAMIVFLQDTDTDQHWPGATCAGGADAGPVPAGGYPSPPCSDAPSAVISVSSAWEQKTIPFAGLTGFPTAGYYDPSSLNEHGVIAADFQVENANAANDAGPPLSFSFCVAQIYFTR